MQSSASGKHYFLRQSGRITGPYSMLKLTAMYNSGALKCEDMCSEDKRRWHYINVLFPALSPAQPIALESPVPAPPAAVDTPVRSTDFAVSSTAVPAVRSRPISPPSLAKEFSVPAELQPPFIEWLTDIGRTIALLWNFPEMLQKHAEKSGRFLGIASGIHVFLGVVFVLLFGRYYSPRFHWFFSPLMGISLLAILWGVAGLLGWFVSRQRTPSGGSSAPFWKICAAGIFMDYGTLACCVMALAHGAWQYPWVRYLFVFIDSFILCSCAMQLRDCLRACGKDWKIPVICAVLLLNPVLAAVIYGFATLI